MVVRGLENITQDEINRIKQSIPRKYTGQSRAVNSRLINHRRNMVHSLLSKGLTTYQVANLIGCSQLLVVSDAAYLRKYYQEQLRYYLQDRLVEIWEQCLTQTHATMADLSRITEDPDVDIRDKLQAYNLTLACIDLKSDLMSQPTIIQEALNVVDNIKRKIIEINPTAAAAAAADVLDSQDQEQGEEEPNPTDAGVNGGVEEEVQPTKQQEEEESEEHQKDEEQQKQKTNNSVF